MSIESPRAFRKIRRSASALVVLATLAACSALTEPSSGGKGTSMSAVALGKVPASGIVMEMFNCTQTDMTDSQFYYCLGADGMNAGSPFADPIYSFCDASPEQCTFTGSAGGIANPAEDSPIEPDSTDAQQTVKPNCSLIYEPLTRERAYCDGSIPGGKQLTRVNAALNRMTAIGGVCAELATIGRNLLATGSLKLFNPVPGAKFGGFGSGPPGSSAWVILQDYWTLYAWDKEHKTPEPNGYVFLDLQSQLAHELEHVKSGAGHANNDLWQTAHSQTCGGF